MLMEEIRLNDAPNFLFAVINGPGGLQVVLHLRLRPLDYIAFDKGKTE